MLGIGIIYCIVVITPILDTMWRIVFYASSFCHYTAANQGQRTEEIRTTITPFINHSYILETLIPDSFNLLIIKVSLLSYTV